MAFVPHFEPLAGTTDGVNTVFTASTAYVGNTFTLIVRGLPRLRDNDDGFAETDPATGIVTLKEAPLEADDVQGVWLEQVPDSVETEVTPLTGSLREVAPMRGLVGPLVDLTGDIDENELFAGRLGWENDILGALRSTESIDGIVEACG